MDEENSEVWPLEEIDRGSGISRLSVIERKRLVIAVLWIPRSPVVSSSVSIVPPVS